MDNVKEITHTVPYEVFDKAKSALDKANAKLHPYEFTYTDQVRVSKDSNGTTYTWVDFIITPNPVIVNNHEFLAAIEKTKEGHLVSYNLSKTTLRKVKDLHCDHCNTNRQRKRIYLVRNGKKIEQVGAACLDEYLGISVPALEKLGKPLLNKHWSEYAPTELSRSYKVIHVLDLALYFSNMGSEFISRNVAYNSCETATADLVRTELNNPTKITKNIRNNVPKTTRDHFISTLANCSENNEWKQKLSRIVSSEYVLNSDLNILVSSMSILAREKRIEEKRNKEAQKTKGFVGLLNGTLRSVFAQVLDITEIETYNDFSHSMDSLDRVRFMSSEGKIILWWTASRHNLEENDYLVFSSGNIKKHNNFNGEDQTTVSKPKFTKLSEEDYTAATSDNN